MMNKIKQKNGYTIVQVLLIIAFLSIAIVILIAKVKGAGGYGGITMEGVSLYFVLMLSFVIPIAWVALYEYIGSLIKVLVSSIMLLAGMLMCFIRFGGIKVELLAIDAVICGLYTLLSRFPTKGYRREVEFFDARREAVSVWEDLIFGAGYGILWPQIAISLITLIER